MLAGWPRNFRKAVSFMVLGWIEGGTFGSGGAKLMKAVVHGGAKPAAKPKKKCEAEEEESAPPVNAFRSKRKRA